MGIVRAVRLPSLFLILAPWFPPLALLALFWIPWLRQIPPWGLVLLGVYGLGLVLPALGTGEALAVGLAFFRFVYTLGLVGLGVALSKAERLGPLGYGLIGVYLLALVASYWVFGERVQEVRLSHPFHSPVGLGFMGALGLLLALHLPYPWPFRLLLGGVGGLVLLLSGSRGGMLALVLGALVCLSFRRRNMVVLGIIGFLVYLGLFLDLIPAQRFLQTGFSGREGLWLAAYEAFREAPWTGFGPYLLGDRLLEVLFRGCFLFPLMEARGLECPSWLAPWGGLWAFAHNHLLQALGESGLFGALALLLLAGGFLASAWGDGFLLSLLLTFLAMGAVDNPFSVPSPFRGEIFFILGGLALARASRPLLEGLGQAALGGSFVLLLWLLPFVYLGSRPEPPLPSLLYAVLPQEGRGWIRLQNGQDFRVQVWLCQEGCRRLGWAWPGDRLIRFPFPEDLPSGRYQLRVIAFSQHPLALRPLCLWTQEVGR